MSAIDLGLGLVRLNPADNVYVSLANTAERQMGHKYACHQLEIGDFVLKYGVQIGEITEKVEPGEHVHTHNLRPLEGGSKRQFITLDSGALLPSTGSILYYKNPMTGKMATARNILIISAVACVNRVVSEIARRFDSNEYGSGSVNVIGLQHSFGCGHVAGSDDLDTLRRVIDGYSRNPNTFYCVVIGLGCEDNQVKEWGEFSEFDYYQIQDMTEERLVAEVEARIANKIVEFNKLNPILAGVEHLTVGLQCGGSDGLSSVTANLLLGYFSTALIDAGATVILSETPEVAGFEDFLVGLCRSEDGSRKLNSIFEDWVKRGNGAANPAPGNYSGGISNHFEKSIGSVLKFGFNEIVDVLEYAEQSKVHKGAVFMDSPGYDPCSVTGQISAGANAIIFTTGRGSNYTNSFLPVLKIGSNPDVSSKHSFIDVDAFSLLRDFETSESVNKLFHELVQKINCFGMDRSSRHSDFIPWIKGGVN